MFITIALLIWLCLNLGDVICYAFARLQGAPRNLWPLSGYFLLWRALKGGWYR